MSELDGQFRSDTCAAQSNNPTVSGGHWEKLSPFPFFSMGLWRVTETENGVADERTWHIVPFSSLSFSLSHNISLSIRKNGPKSEKP